jgi:hypothetical protein
MSTRVVKWSEDLNKTGGRCLPLLEHIRIYIYIYHMKFAVYMAVSFIKFFDIFLF